MTYIFHGIGDRGGAPEEESVKFVEEEISKTTAVILRFGIFSRPNLSRY